MTKEGYRTIIVKTEAYKVLNDIAEKEGISIGKVVEKALDSFTKEKKDKEVSP